VRVHPNDDQIDITLCPICLKRKIRMRSVLGSDVPSELLDFVAALEREA